MREVHGDLLREDSQQELCVLVWKAAHRARDVARICETKCAEMLTEVGFKQGSPSARAFYRVQEDIAVIALGDDCTVLGKEQSLCELRGVPKR